MIVFHFLRLLYVRSVDVMTSSHLLLFSSIILARSNARKRVRLRSGSTSSDHPGTSLATLLGLHEGIVIFAAFVQEAIIELHKSSIHVLCSAESHKTSVQYIIVFKVN